MQRAEYVLVPMENKEWWLYYKEGCVKDYCMLCVCVCVWGGGGGGATAPLFEDHNI